MLEYLPDTNVGNIEYIRKQDALDAFGLSEKTRKYGGDHSGYDTRMLYEIQDTIESLEPADVVQVRHGKWMKEDRGHVEYCAVCDQCGFDWMWSDRGYFKFCPNCGAKMDGDE